MISVWRLEREERSLTRALWNIFCVSALNWCQILCFNCIFSDNNICVLTRNPCEPTAFCDSFDPWLIDQLCAQGSTTSVVGVYVINRSGVITLINSGLNLPWPNRWVACCSCCWCWCVDVLLPRAAESDPSAGRRRWCTRAGADTRWGCRTPQDTERRHLDQRQPRRVTWSMSRDPARLRRRTPCAVLCKSQRYAQTPLFRFVVDLLYN